MKMRKMILTFSMLTLMSSCVAGVSITPDTYNIAQSFDLGKNYYTVYGSPNITASIIGNYELDRGQSVTLNIQLMNKGKLLGYKSEKTPSDSDEIFAAKTEMNLESIIVDATNVMASLSTDPGSPIEVKSVSQNIGTIKSGQNSLAPAIFVIKINKKAKAGEYNLYLNLSYDYQSNVQILNPDATTETYSVNKKYSMISQTQILKIKVKNQADFEILNTTGSLYQGSDGIIDIAIKNMGEEEARNAIAIISPSDPLSTTDGTAYLSTIEPGGIVTAHVKIKADSASVTKFYGVETQVKYQTPEGDTNYSDVMQAPVEVKKQGFFQSLFGWL